MPSLAVPAGRIAHNADQQMATAAADAVAAGSVAEAASLGIIAESWEELPQLEEAWRAVCQSIHPSALHVCAYCGVGSPPDDCHWKAVPAVDGAEPPYAAANIFAGKQCFASADGTMWHQCR